MGHLVPEIDPPLRPHESARRLLEEMEVLAGALVGWTWADPDSLADEGTARLVALVEEIRERLVRVEGV